MFSMQCIKNIAVEDSNKITNIADFINMYPNIYVPILYGCYQMKYFSGDSFSFF